MSPAAGPLRRILILTDWYEPGYRAGGPIQSVRNFVAAMGKYYELSVITSDRDLGDDAPYPGIVTNQWVSRSPGVRVYYTAKLERARLQQLIAGIDPDFIYLNSLYSFPYSVQLLWLLRLGRIKAKVVLSPRGMLRASAVAHKSRKKKPFLVMLRALRLPEKISFHATDEQELTDIRSHFPATGPVSLIPNFSPALNPVFAPVTKIPGRVSCVFIGRIMDIKNPAFFITLLQKIPAGARLELAIYGSVENENYWTAIQSQIATLPPQVEVVYHGPVPHAEVQAVLEKHHLFVLPTRGENFGHAIFESFAAGRPVLISDKTPWRGLEKKAAGFDLPLDRPGEWLRAIAEVARWNQDDFNEHAAAAFKLARDYQAATDLTAAYQKLFS